MEKNTGIKMHNFGEEEKNTGIKWHDFGDEEKNAGIKRHDFGEEGKPPYTVNAPVHKSFLFLTVLRQRRLLFSKPVTVILSCE